MSFVCCRLISRSQNWLKRYLVVFDNLKIKGKCTKHLYIVAVIIRSLRKRCGHIFLVYWYPDLTLFDVVHS